MGLFSHTTLGIDVGHAAVRVVALEVQGKARVRLHGCKEVDLPVGAITHEGIIDLKAVAAAVRQACKEAAPKKIGPVQQLYMAVPEVKVFRKVIDLPALEREEEVRLALQLELEQYLPGEKRDVEVDYQVLDSGSAEGIQQVLAVAVPRRVIADYMGLAKMLRLPLTAIDTKPSAVARAMVTSGEKNALLLVDVASGTTTVSLYYQGMVRITGTVNMGGDMLKDETGALLPESAGLDAKVAKLVSVIADEVAHVMKFWSNRTLHPQPVHEVRLVGSGSMIAGFSEYLSAEITLPVQPAKPVITLPPFCDRRFYGALGSALYGVSDVA
jgi:type IV pilus assembly protein PilM